MRRSKMTTPIDEEKEVATRRMTKTAAPQWLLTFWKEIDNKTFGKFARICAPSLIPALPPGTMLLNTGTLAC